MEEDFFEKLKAELPPIFARKEVSRLTGGLVAPGTMANADSLGLGPSKRMRTGRHVVYERDSFVAWLRGRIRQL